MTNLDWNQILDHLADLTTSQLGRERVLALAPLDHPDQAAQSFSEIAAAAAILNLGRRPFAESLDLYQLWAQRLSKEATLKTLELRDVRHFCHEVLALTEIVRPHEDLPWAVGLVADVFDATEPLSAIDQIMTAEGAIRTDASEALFKLFNEKNAVVKQTQNILDKLVRQHDLELVLQDRYVTNREGRWVLPIRSARQGQFEGITHASSQSKQTVFMEPKEIIPLNNRLRQIETDIEDEIERLLAELSDYLRSRLSDFNLAQSRLLDADVRFAEAQLAVRTEAEPCAFSADHLSLKDLRHPLLILKNVDVVANTVELAPDQRLLLLSGPNAGGKTVLLKSVGLAAQMARCGLPIAAGEGSVVPFFANIFVGVGDSQSVDQHLSTFAAHLKILNEAAHAGTNDTLLLIDEICGSTDPDEGTALARAFIQRFAKNQSFGVITSHLGPLKLGWAPESGVVNGSLEYDAKSGRPTYMFLMGIPGQSLALQTARRVGVDPEILDAAVEFLSPEIRAYHSGLEEVEIMKEDLRRLREQSLKDSREAKEAKSRYHALQQAFERDRDKLMDKELRKAEKKIETLIEHSKVDDVFRRHERLEQMRQTMPEIVKSSSAAKPSIPRIESAEDFGRAYPPGTKVFAVTIGRDAVIQSAPNAKGEIAVLSNSMRLLVPWTQLKPAQAAHNPTVDIVRRAGEVASPLDQDRTVDVRGHSVPEAVSLLESQLDVAALNQEARVKVVHGHGTDVLKKGIRAHLSRSHYVKTWKAGTPESGGDGVTWVELRD